MSSWARFPGPGRLHPTLNGRAAGIDRCALARNDTRSYSRLMYSRSEGMKITQAWISVYFTVAFSALFQCRYETNLAKCNACWSQDRPRHHQPRFDWMKRILTLHLSTEKWTCLEIKKKNEPRFGHVGLCKHRREPGRAWLGSGASACGCRLPVLVVHILRTGSSGLVQLKPSVFLWPIEPDQTVFRSWAASPTCLSLGNECFNKEEEKENEWKWGGGGVVRVTGQLIVSF